MLLLIILYLCIFEILNIKEPVIPITAYSSHFIPDLLLFISNTFKILTLRSIALHLCPIIMLILSLFTTE